MREKSDQSTHSGRPTERSWRRHLGRGLLLYVLTPYLTVTLIFTVLQRRFLYPATQTGRLRAADVVGDYADDVVLQASDGLPLHGWHVHPDDATPEEDRLLVLYFPGNAGCRRDRINDCRDFTHLGCDVLLFDYRGYGDNSGAPNETHLAHDAQGMWRFALGELRFAPEQIILYGESLGGAVAVRLAAELSLAGTPPAGLVLNSTFASMPETVSWHYPAFPFQFLLLDRYPSVERIPRVTCPLLQFHGTNDEIVPAEQGRMLFAAAREQSPGGAQKRFVVIEGGTHNSIPVSRLTNELSLLLFAVRANGRNPPATSPAPRRRSGPTDSSG